METMYCTYGDRAEGGTGKLRIEYDSEAGRSHCKWQSGTGKCTGTGKLFYTCYFCRGRGKSSR